MPAGNFSGLGFGVSFMLKDGFSKTADKIDKKMGQLDNSTSKMTSNVTGKLQKLAVGFGLGASMGVAISKSAELSDQLAEMGKVTQMTDAELEGLRVQLENMDTRRSLPELLELSKLGKQLGVAKEQLGDFAVQADMIGATLGSSFGGSAEAAVEKMGKLSKVFKETRDVGVEEGLGDIANAINSLTQTGAVSGQKLTEFASKLGQLGDMGTTASQALGLGAALDELGLKTKGMASSYGSVIKAMGESRENMAAFANQVGMTTGEFEAMFNADPNKSILTLAKSMKGMSNVDMLSTLKDLKLPSAEVARLMNILADNIGLVEKRQLQAAQAMSEGTSVSSEFAKQNVSLGAQIGKLKRNFDIFLTRLGDGLGAALAPFLNLLNDIIRAMTKFAQSDFGKSVIKYTTLVGGLVVGTIALTKGIKMLGGAFTMLKNKAIASITAMSPMMLVIAPIVALVMAVRSATGAFDEFNGTVKTGLGGFMQKFGGIIRAIQEIWSSWDSVNQQFSMSSGLVEKLTQLGIYDLALAIGTWVVRIKEFLMGIGEGFKIAFKTVWSIVSPVFNAIGNLMSKLGFTIGKNTTAVSAFAKAGKIAGMVLLGIIGALTVKFIAMGVASLAAFAPMIIAGALVVGALYLIYKAATWVIGIFEDIGEWAGSFVDIGKSIIGGIWKGIQAVWSTLTGWLSDLYNFGASIVGAIWDGIKSVFSWLFSWAEDAVGVGSAIVNGIWSGITGLWDTVVGWASGLWDWAKGIGSSIANGISAGWETVKGWASSLWDTAKSWGGWIAGGVKEGWSMIKGFYKNMWDTAKSWGGALVDGVKSGWDTIKGWGSSIWDWASGVGTDIADGISSGWDTVKGWASSMWDWATGVGSTMADGVSSGWDTISEWSSDLYSTAKDWGSWLYKGMTGGFNATDLVNNAIETLNKDLGTNIKSVGTDVDANVNMNGDAMSDMNLDGSFGLADANISGGMFDNQMSALGLQTNPSTSVNNSVTVENKQTISLEIDGEQIATAINEINSNEASRE